MTTILTGDTDLASPPELRRWVSCQSPKTLLGHSKLVAFLKDAAAKDGDSQLTKEMAAEILAAVMEKEHAYAPPKSMRRQISDFSSSEKKLGRKVSFKSLAMAVKHMSRTREQITTSGKRRTSQSDGLSISSIETLMSDLQISKDTHIAEEMANTKGVVSHSFDILKLCAKLGGDVTANSKALEIVSFSILLHFSLINRLGLDVMVAKNYLRAVGNAYCAVPYHNAAHGADVMQTMASNLYASPKFLSSLSDEALFAGLMAACKCLPTYTPKRLPHKPFSNARGTNIPLSYLLTAFSITEK